MGSKLVAGVALMSAMVFQHAAAQTPSSDDIIANLRPKAAQLTGPTRGIRRMPAPALPGRAGARAQTQAAAAEPPEASAPSVKLVVDFQTGSAELTPSATHTLDQLGKALSSAALGSYRFRIEGHTDTVGSPEANKGLSERRAETVASYLESKFSIGQERLEPVGLGSSQLLVQTPDQTAEPRNRRVRVVNLGS